jgi:hypothetical protein
VLRERPAMALSNKNSYVTGVRCGNWVEDWR